MLQSCQFWGGASFTNFILPREIFPTEMRNLVESSFLTSTAKQNDIIFYLRKNVILLPVSVIAIIFAFSFWPSRR